MRECNCNEKKQDNTIAMIMAIIGIVVVVAGVAFAVYKFITKRKEEKEFEEMLDAMDDDACIELDYDYPEESLTEEEE